MKRHLVLLGGGHAHLSLLAAAAHHTAEGHRVTLVSPDPVHYYSGMGPGMLGGTYAPEEIRFPLERMAVENGVTFVRDRAVRVFPDRRFVELAAGNEMAYDVLSVNTGSSIAPTVAVDEDVAGNGPRVFTAKPLSQMLEARRFVESRATTAPLRIVVVGGGAAALESAANLRRLLREVAGADRAAESSVTLIVGRAVLPGFPRRAERLAMRAMRALGVEVRMAEYVRRISRDGIVSRAGTEPADLVLLATGVVPSRLFADSGMPVGPDGSMAVNENLHCLGYPSVFGAGDCVWFTPQPLPRAGVFAVRESAVLANNVAAALGGDTGRLRRFSPGGGYLLLLNLGDGTALFSRTVLGVPIVYRGSSAWTLKDRIDRSFVERFGSEADRGDEQ